MPKNMKHMLTLLCNHLPIRSPHWPKRFWYVIVALACTFPSVKALSASSLAAANTEKSLLLTQAQWWLLHIKKKASLTELANQWENGEACVCITHVFSVQGGVAFPINHHHSTPLQPVRLCTDCHQGKLHWLVILFTRSFNYTNIKRETFFKDGNKQGL